MFFKEKYPLKYENVKWSMPFLFTSSSINIVLFNHLFNNKTIEYVFGAPKCAWCGGRRSLFTTKDIDLLEKSIHSIAASNVTPSFTLSNTKISNQMLKDEFCNVLLRIISESNSEIILVSDLLYDYIKDKYPNIKICASIIKSTYENVKNIDETEHINNLTEKFDRVVIRPEYALKQNGNFSNIKNVGKLELLVNGNCAYNCDASNACYRILQLRESGVITVEDFVKASTKNCPLARNINIKRNNLDTNFVQKCINNGITKLKMNGRHWNYKQNLDMLYEYFFSSKINKKRFEKELEKYTAEIVQKDIQLQALSILSNNKGEEIVID